MYRGGDGKWFVIGMLLDRAWPDVCARDRPAGASRTTRASTRSASASATNAAALIAILDEVFATAPAREWVDRLNTIGMFAAPVQDYAEVAADPQVVANGYIHEVEHPGHDPVRHAGHRHRASTASR